MTAPTDEEVDRVIAEMVNSATGLYPTRYQVSTTFWRAVAKWHLAQLAARPASSDPTRERIAETAREIAVAEASADPGSFCSVTINGALDQAEQIEAALAAYLAGGGK